jgi:hypothetical protein
MTNEDQGAGASPKCALVQRNLPSNLDAVSGPWMKAALFGRGHSAGLI